MSTSVTRWMRPHEESPVLTRLAELPHGTGDWPEHAYVHRCIRDACESMGRSHHGYMSAEHVNALAVLACGHRATMKYELSRLRMRGFC